LVLRRRLDNVEASEDVRGGARPGILDGFLGAEYGREADDPVDVGREFRDGGGDLHVAAEARLSVGHAGARVAVEDGHGVAPGQQFTPEPPAYEALSSGDADFHLRPPLGS